MLCLVEAPLGYSSCQNFSKHVLLNNAIKLVNITLMLRKQECDRKKTLSLPIFNLARILDCSVNVTMVECLNCFLKDAGSSSMVLVAFYSGPENYL